MRIGLIATLLGVLIVTEATADLPLVERRAKDLIAARSGTQGVPREAVQGYPIPLLHDGELWLVSLYFLRRGRPPEPPELTRPGWVARVDEKTGKTVQVRKLDNDLEVPVGPHVLPKDMDMEAFKAAEAELYATLTQLLDVARYPDRPLREDEAEAAKRFLELFDQIGHRPLMEDYRNINPAWWELIESAR